MSDYECENDSDKELQVAFKKGLLKDLVRETEKVLPKKINNKQGLQESLDSFKKSLPWIETLDVCVEPLPLPSCATLEFDEMSENHIKRENLFYRQAQAAVLFGVEKLNRLKVPTKRPSDYYAEMVKSDDHMKKVKEKLLSLQAMKQKIEKAKKDREAKKFNKLAAKQIKESKKKERLKNKDQLKKMKKKVNFGKDIKDDFNEKKGSKEGGLKQTLERSFKSRKEGFKPRRESNFKTEKEGGFKPRKGGNFKTEKEGGFKPRKGGNFKTEKEGGFKPRKEGHNKPGNKRNMKNMKYGFGGQKKRSKTNNKDSFNDV